MRLVNYNGQSVALHQTRHGLDEGEGAGAIIRGELAIIFMQL